MSTSAAAISNQLYFPWMSDSQTDRTKKDKSHPGKNSKQQNSRRAKGMGQQVVDPSAVTKLETPATLSTKEFSGGLATPRDGMRVGQVRIGNVMLSLLKRYGITDQEISDVLGTIAMENCQKAAS